jgi:multisubunit Na+/H+ antiporter MnhB subunit
MFTEIARYLDDFTLPIAFAFILFILIYDQKTIERIRGKKWLKKGLLFSIIVFFIQIIVGIIFIILKR